MGTRGRAAGSVTVYDLRRRADSFLESARALHDSVSRGIARVEELLAQKPAPKKSKKK